MTIAPQISRSGNGMWRVADAALVAKRIEKNLKDARTAVSESLEDGRVAAERLFKRSKHAIEDAMQESTRRIKRHPFRSVAIAFAAGAAVALLVPRPSRK